MSELMNRRRLVVLRQHLVASSCVAAVPPSQSDPAHNARPVVLAPEDTGGPLAGYRILDLSVMVSGPMATQILADQGAEVWKIEPPKGAAERGGARTRMMSPLASVVNRNKRSLAVDLKRAEGRELLYRLVRCCDAILHNFRPGAAERMGIDFRHLRTHRPDLVYVHITGFGPSGPYAGKRVYDPVIQGATGLMSIQANAAGRPQQLRLIIPDKVTALTAAQALCAGLLRRERTGRGGFVELSMMDALLSFAWAEGFAQETFRPEETSDDHGHGHNHDPNSSGSGGAATGLGAATAASRGNTSSTPATTSTTPPRTKYAYTRDMVYECKDGFVTVGAVQDKEWEALCAALEKPGWRTDPRFATRAARGDPANREARYDLTEAVLRGMTVAEVLSRCGDEVPCGVVHHPRDAVLRDPQVAHNEILFTTAHPRAPFPLLQPHAPMRIDGRRLAQRHHAPVVGEGGRSIMRDAGYSDLEVDALVAAGVAVCRDDGGGGGGGGGGENTTKGGAGSRAASFDPVRARAAIREVSSG